MKIKNLVDDVFAKIEVNIPSGNLKIHSPINGGEIAAIQTDDRRAINKKIGNALTANHIWENQNFTTRQKFLDHLSKTVAEYTPELSSIITYESGKTPKEAEGEAKNISTTIATTIKNANTHIKNKLHTESMESVGIVGLITSYNFPLAVAGWTMAPALLAGNTVIWKPSEKTPLTAIIFKKIFDEAIESFEVTLPKEILQIVIGDKDAGEAMVSSEDVKVISATGSVAMGQAIKQALSLKNNGNYKHILELGGNNAIVISEHNDDKDLEFAVTSILKSVFATGGQRCTNTRRVIVHEKIHEKVASILKEKFQKFINSDSVTNPIESKDDTYMYAPLIDKVAYQNFESAKIQAATEGGKVFFGARALADKFPNAYYVAPCLALMPEQTNIMYNETFGPILFVIKYKDNIENAIDLVNEPVNAGLVNGIYTNNQEEINLFAEKNLSGHSVVNSPKGTGTPAHGMGFGGNKESGEGIILSPNPLQPFTEAGQHELANYKPTPAKPKFADGITTYILAHKDHSTSRIAIHDKK